MGQAPIPDDHEHEFEVLVDASSNEPHFLVCRGCDRMWSVRDSLPLLAGIILAYAGG